MYTGSRGQGRGAVESWRPVAGRRGIWDLEIGETKRYFARPQEGEKAKDDGRRGMGGTRLVEGRFIVWGGERGGGGKNLN